MQGWSPTAPRSGSTVSTPDLPALLAGAAVDEAVRAMRPDYRALLVVVTGVRGGPTDETSDAALRRAEESARARLAGAPPESLPEIAAWREAEERQSDAELRLDDLWVQTAPYERLVRALDDRLLAARLHARGGPQWNEYQKLLACERGVP